MLPMPGHEYGMAGRREVRHQQLVGAAVGRVVDALAALVLDDVALVVQLLLVGLVEQRRQAVGLDPQQRLEVGRRHGREVVGAVAAGGAVDAALTDVRAHLLDRAKVLAGHVRRALEHQVLEEVGEAGPSRHSRSSSRRGTTGSRGRSAACDRRAGSAAGRSAARASRTRPSAPPSPPAPRRVEPLDGALGPAWPAPRAGWPGPGAGLAGAGRGASTAWAESMDIAPSAQAAAAAMVAAADRVRRRNMRSSRGPSAYSQTPACCDALGTNW